MYHYAPNSDSEEANMNEMKFWIHHDAPTARHYAAEGTTEYTRDTYYRAGMTTFITNYVKNCAGCLHYKASNTKPAGLLQAPIAGGERYIGPEIAHLFFFLSLSELLETVKDLSIC